MERRMTFTVEMTLGPGGRWKGTNSLQTHEHAFTNRETGQGLAVVQEGLITVVRTLASECRAESPAALAYFRQGLGEMPRDTPPTFVRHAVRDVEPPSDATGGSHGR
jgi:hypothetical protein